MQVLNFLYDCNNLINIDLSSLNNLKQIGKWFLYNNTKLISINLSGLNNLEIIGNKFLIN